MKMEISSFVFIKFQFLKTWRKTIFCLLSASVNIDYYVYVGYATPKWCLPYLLGDDA